MDDFLTKYGYGGRIFFRDKYEKNMFFLFLYFVPSIKALPCSGEKYVIFLLRHFSCFSCFGLVLHFLSHFVDFWSIIMKLSELMFH